MTPEEFYQTEDGQHHATTSGMRRVQTLLAKRLEELLEITQPGKHLELGISAGFSAEYFQEKGHKVEGIDVAENILEITKEKGFKANVGDMRDLKNIYKEGEFDTVSSISALQWLKGDAKDLKKVAEGIYHVLKPNGKAGIQFYPKDNIELDTVKKAFADHFDGGVVIDNPENPRKRRIYVILKKNKFKYH